MTWEHVNGSWSNGSYEIALIRPGEWTMRRLPESIGYADSDVWTGRSLRLMKQRAERLEQEAETSRDNVRRWIRLGISLIGIPLFFDAPDPIGVFLVVGLVGVLIHSIVGLMDGLGSRQWDLLRESMQ